MESGSELTINVGGSFIKLDPGGVSISGGTVNINSGGSAGQGTKPQAKPPKLPLGVEAVTTAPNTQLLAQAPLLKHAAQMDEALVKDCQRQLDGSCPRSDCPCRAEASA